MAAPDLGKIQLPPHFKISVYATGIENARSMALSPSGTLFAATRNERKIYAITNTNDITEKIVVAKPSESANGVAFKDGNLYVAENERILVYRDIEKHLKDSPKAEVLNENFGPHSGNHGWKFIRFGPDGDLYVGVGAPCNVCLKEETRFASITKIALTKNAPLKVVAQGVRNSVGFDWHPTTKELWFTDNGRDWLGDDSPPDELNRLSKEGEHFGFPFCFGTNTLDPKFGEGKKCKSYTAPIVELPAHAAALGMRFYRGTQFPAKYRNSIFIAEHGSWNRSTPIGYRLSVVTFDSKMKATYEVFASGWLQNGDSWGRPVDVEEMADGSLLISDDQSGNIYRITYQK